MSDDDNNNNNNEEEDGSSSTGRRSRSRSSSDGSAGAAHSPRLQRVPPPPPPHGVSRAPSRGDEEDAEEEEEVADRRRFDADRVLRCDIAKALMRCSAEAIALNPERDAPPFAVAFEMLEPTTIPRLLQDAVWVLNNIKSCTEKGEGGAYITGLPGLSVTLDATHANKSVVQQTLPDGSRTQLNEMALQIRVQEVSAWMVERQPPQTPTTEAWRRRRPQRVEVRERFLLLVARSPLAFSLRKAAYTTTRSVGRLTLQDTRGADERRRVWAQLAMHVRAPLDPPMRGGDLMEKFEPSMDWMRSSEADGFTCLFSVHRAVDWMKARFITKHARRYRFVGDLEVMGLVGRMSLPRSPGGGGAADDEEEEDYDDDAQQQQGGGGGDDFLVGPGFVDDCRVYDEDVDREVERTYRVGGNKKRRLSGGSGNNRGNNRGNNNRGNNNRGNNNRGNNRSNRPEVEEGAEVVEEGAEIAEEVGSVRAYPGLELPPSSSASLELRRGIPEAVVAMQVVLRTAMEASMGRTELRQHMRIFPESVMLELLRGQLQLPLDLLCSMHKRMCERTLEVTTGEMRDIVMGDGEFNLGRPMLAHGDAAWGKQMTETVLGVTEGGAVARLATLDKFMQMGFALSYTRAKGSDSYSNGRVAAYGRYMTFENGDLSRDECQDTYAKMRLGDTDDADGDAEAVDGSSLLRAMEFALRVVLECDQCMWNLRPDNLHLFMQLLVSDLMLCLNYHGSVIDGASNGIGSTVVIRDGGGSFRQWYKDVGSGVLMLGQVMSKGNGTGADHCVGAYKKVVSIGNYDDRFRMQREFITEMKRATETSLIQETCNTIEWRGSTPTIKHLIEETDGRKYSTELKAGADQQSLNNMQAISWLIPRNTVAMDCNCFTTTREDGDSKERIRVEYRQVSNGYFAICSNVVREGARERFHTVLAVTRTVVASAAGGEMDEVMQEGLSDDEGYAEGLRSQEAHNARNGRVDRAVVSGKEQELHRAARPVFFVGMSTAVFAGFIQWTGMLDRVRETRTAEAILGVFYAHLELCQDLLNPDMASSGDKMRYLQVSKARGVAMGLFGLSLRETLDAGRRGLPQQRAVERTALALKLEGGSSMVAWVIADTLEHMFRLDFFLLMGMLGNLLRVPCVGLEELLAWLDTGRREDCPKAEDFLRLHTGELQGSDEQRRAREASGVGLLESGVMDSEGRGLMPSRHCLYISAPLLRVPLKVATNTQQGRKLFCEALGARLRREFTDALKNKCRIEDNEEGDEIVRAMLVCSLNRSFAWPSVLGEATTLRDFWKGRAPPPAHPTVLRNNPTLQRELARLALPPLRMISIENTVGQLGVDVRWLLLTGALCEGQLSQSSRFAAVAQLVQRFYQYCVPNALVPSDRHFIGLPSQITCTGFVWPRVMPTARRLLRRPGRKVGMDAPCRTGMVEDMGAAAPRFEMAQMLGVDERDLPTEAVHYDLPHGVWMPALLGEREDVPGAVRWENGRLHVWGEGLPERRDVTLMVNDEEALDDDRGVYLGGRSTERVRPTPAFYRPGVVVNGGPAAPRRLGVVGAFDPSDGRYTIHWQQPPPPRPTQEEQEEQEEEEGGPPPGGHRLTPYEVQARVLLPDAEVWCTTDMGSSSSTTPAVAVVACFLDYQGGEEEEAEGVIGVRMPRPVPPHSAGTHAHAAGGLFGASHGARVRRAYEERYAARTRVHIDGVALPPPDPE